jgi:undecaprenyl-diphosphatase
VTAEPLPDRRRLLPAAIRLPAAVLAVCCAVGFVVLAVRYHDVHTYGRFDRWVSDSVPRWRDLPHAVLAPLTDVLPAVLLVLTGVVAIAALVTRRWSYAALAVLGPGLTMLLTEVGKLLVGRLHEGAPSLPSGHTAAVTSVAVVMALLVVGRSRAHPVLAAAVGAATVTVAAGAMAFVLVALHYHYATDTIAGYGIAVAGTLGVAFTVDAFTARRARAATPHRRAGSADRLAQPSA